MNQRDSLLAKCGAIVLLGLSFGFAQAALPPQYQNEKDLTVMMDYVKAHPEVMSSLHAIDLNYYTVYYGEGCSVLFEREQVERPEGWVGPAAPLVFKAKQCEEKTQADSGFTEISEDMGGITARDTEACGPVITEEGCE